MPHHFKNTYLDILHHEINIVLKGTLITVSVKDQMLISTPIGQESDRVSATYAHSCMKKYTVPDHSTIESYTVGKNVVISHQV